MTTLLLGTRKGLLTYTQTKTGWEPTKIDFAGSPVSHTMRDPRTNIRWAALDHGHWGSKLWRSMDEGATWEEMTAPAYPEGTMRSDGEPATVSYLWLIAPGGKDQPDRMYVGSEPGGLFQSDDGGCSFKLVESLWNHPTREKWWFGGGRDHPGVCSVVVDPRDSNHILIGISVGGVFETTDGGQHWETRNKGLLACYLPDPHSEAGHDPHYMVASPSNPDVLWQQNHCGVFRSVDGAKTWQDISQPEQAIRFGFAIAVDAKDENTAWVVPAISDSDRRAVDRALSVCRTEDGGKTWTTLRNGLPQRETYDVVFRHALDINGEQLAFGSTTGNLFFSADRGDSWQTIGHHLPPIYSVRFTP
ncbi:MAG: glycosyl hydrolase [Anaerolineae bacterium]|nr:glycosyl hydrolase [Anaerolineae bacterium]